MAKDFRSDRVRTRAIIGTGSVVAGKKNLNLMFYSGSKATNHDGANSISATTIGDDVWLYIDGVPNSVVDPGLKAHGSTVLFGGDVVVSGTLWSERSVVEVDDSVPGDFKAFNKIIGGMVTSPENYKTGFARILVDPTTANPSANRDGTISFNMVQGVDGAYAYATQFPSKHKDVFFHVSGSRGVRDSNDRGLALFDGDVHVSGNLSLSPLSIFTVPGDFTIGGDLTVNGNDILGSAGQAIEFETPVPNVHIRKGLKVGNNAITGSDGNTQIFMSGSSTGVGIEGALQIAGNEIKAADGGSTITFDNSGNVTTVGNITVTGNIIKASDGGSTITMDVDDNVTIGGDLTIMGDDIKGSDDVIRITLGSSVLPTVFNGDIQVSGKDIKGADGVTALHLSGSGNATFDKNLTVLGDLNISGSVTSIATQNLRVKDAMVLLASGSTVNNTPGGIAIASGSKHNNKALTFGAGIAATNRWRLGYKDVQDGSVSNVSDAEAVGLELASIHFKDTIDDTFALTYITASIVGGTSTKLDIRNGDGGIYLTPNNHVYIPQSNRLYFDGSTATRYIEAGGGGDMTIDSGAGNIGFAFNTKAVFAGAAGNSELELLAGARSKIQVLPKAAPSYRETTSFTGGAMTTLGSDSGNASSGTEARTSVLILSASSNESIGGPQIILSSSTTIAEGTNLREGVVIIGANANDISVGSDGIDRNPFSMTKHRDVRTLLSGAVGTANSNTRGVTLVSGDLVVSGNSSLRGTVAIGSLDLENLTLSSTSTPGPYIDFRDSNVRIRRNGNNLEFDDLNGPSRTLTELAALSVVDNTNVFSVTPGDMAVSGIPSFVRTSGSFSFDTGLNPAVGGIRATSTIGSDVYFFVSGSRGDRYSHTTRGTAVFGGDMVVSGAVLISAPSSTVPLQIGTASTSTAAAVAITGSIELYDPSPGGVIQIATKTASSGLALGVVTGTALEIDSSANTKSYGSLTMNANNTLILKDSNRTLHGYLDTGVEKLKIKNANTNGVVVIEANNGSGHLAMTGSILPGANTTYNLGSPNHRWANLYTGDLHLKNERGNWTIYEEPDMLVVVNNLTGKKYKMGLTPLEDTE